MQRVDTDENAHLRGDNDHVRVPAKHNCRTTRHADHEMRQRKDLAQILTQIMWIPTILSTVGFFFQIPKGEATSGAILASRLFTYGTKVAKAGVMNPVLQKFPKQRRSADPVTEVDSHNTVCGWCAQAHVPTHSCDFTNRYFQGQEIGRILLYHFPKGEATGGAFLASRLSIFGTMGARAEVMNSVLQKCSTGKEEHKAKGNTERVQSITHDARYDSTREATASGYMKRFNSRFLAWIARQTRSDLLYRFSKILSTFEKCLCQRLTCARLHCGICSIRIHEQHQILFQILLGIKRLSRDSGTTVSVINGGDLTESSKTLKSHQADITALELGDAWNAVRMLIHPLSWSLMGIRRICRRSLMVETYVLSNVEQGLRTRSVVFDMKGQLNVHQSIDLPALKQFIWDNHDEEADGLMSCYFRWVDMLATLSDYLSKKMTSRRPGNTSSTNISDKRPNENIPLSKKRMESGEH